MTATRFSSSSPTRPSAWHYVPCMTQPTPSATEATRIAIEFLTPYVAADSEEKRAEAASYIAQRLAGPDDALIPSL